MIIGRIWLLSNIFFSQTHTQHFYAERKMMSENKGVQVRNKGVQVRNKGY